MNKVYIRELTDDNIKQLQEKKRAQLIEQYPHLKEELEKQDIMIYQKDIIREMAPSIKEEIFIENDVDFKRFENREEYLSIIITHYQPEPNRKYPEKTVDRYALLERCVNSIHQHADFPVEIIIADDSGVDRNCLNIKDKVSTIIYNCGKPLGLNTQTNRAIRLSTSKYILQLEDDLEILQPCFKDVVNILKKPYVGFINGVSFPRVANEYFEQNGTKFIIGKGLDAAWFNAFRKDVWKEIGGYPEFSHLSRGNFCWKIIKHGYFRGWLLGDKRVRNYDQEVLKSTQTTGQSTSHGNFPRIFHIHEGLLDLLSQYKYHSSTWQTNRVSRFDGAVNNNDYWFHFVNQLTSDLDNCVSSIDWSVAQQYNHSRWKEQILRDVKRK